MTHLGEVSVEEILESIKRVIARDAPGEAPRAPAAAAEHGAELGHDILAHDINADDVLDLVTLEAPGSGLGADSAPSNTPFIGLPEAPLVTPATSAAMRESLAGLAALQQHGAPPPAPRGGETSLEELARALLRPALSAWLEANLPGLVERMVAAEIARIVGKPG